MTAIAIFDGDRPAYSLTHEQLLETHAADCRGRAVRTSLRSAPRGGGVTSDEHRALVNRGAARLLTSGRLGCLCEGTST